MEYINTKCIRRWSVEGVGTPNRSSPSVARTMKIFNEIPYTIGISSRDGLKYDLPPGTNLVQTGVVVWIQYDFKKFSRESLEKLLCSGAVQNSPELQLLKQVFSQDGGGMYGRFNKFDIEYVITEKDLLDHGGTVYVRDLDLVISTKGCGAIKYHPYSKEANLYAFGEQSLSELDNISGQNFIYSINLIDNFGQIGRRWLRIGDDVVAVNPVRDETKTDGVYVATNKPSVNSIGDGRMVVERYDVEETPPYFKLYKTFHDARHTAADDMAMKLAEYESKRLKSETDLTISQNALNRVTQEAENLRRNAELQEAKHKDDMHRMRMQLDLEMEERLTMRRKDRYEAASAARKDTAELVKVVPAIILGIIGVVATAQKVFAKK